MTFIEFAEMHGLIIDRIDMDRWVRTKTIDHPHKKNGAYFHGGDFAHVQNWASMTSTATWISDRVSTPADLEGMRRRMEKARHEQAQERRRLQQSAAEKAQAIIDKCAYEQHAYLDRKGFPDFVGLVYRPDEQNNLLVIPMHVGGQICGCQMIGTDGTKKFLFGQRCAGADHVLDGRGIDIWCEGYATGLSIKAVMDALKSRYRIHICFSAGNMQAMAIAAGRGYIIADNDASNAGEAAALATGMPYFLPPSVGQDFNDYHRAVGTFRASQAIRRFLQLM